MDLVSEPIPAIPTVIQSPHSPTMVLVDQPKKCEKIRANRGSKDELRYWKRAIRRVPGSPYWYCEIQRTHIRRKLSLETSIPEVAARKAREIWQLIRVGGWPAYDAKYRPDAVNRSDVSVGDYLERVHKYADLLPRTRAAYTAALRKIVSDLGGYSGDSARFGHGKGKRAWLARLDAVKLSTLTPAAIQQWKRGFLAAADQDPVSQRSARTSCNSFLRQAKSLFSARITKHLGLELPTSLPFSDVTFEPRPSCKYRSTFSITGLVEAARTELANEPEVYKAFLLSVYAGLRRKEIDLLQWESFIWDQGIIRVQTTEFFEAKSEDSLGDVALEPQVMELFKGWHACATGRFVIESANAPRPGCLYNFYRAEEVFSRLIAWLRAHGVSGPKPLHCLRKEYGSEICKHAGVYAASRALRHSNISVTTQYYVEDRTRSVVGLGHLLSENKVVEFRREEVA